MRERGDGLSLALEAGERHGIVGQLGGEDLDGHVAGELGIAGAVNLADAPAPSGARIS